MPGHARIYGYATTTPLCGIGQRAYLLRTGSRNILWDFITYRDERTIDQIKVLGGIQAIAISHPHYYSTMVDWSEVFGNVPIYIQECDRKWVMRWDDCIEVWIGERKDLLNGELSLICTGGHFDGYQVLYWPAGAEDTGVIMSGDQPKICKDPTQVGFIYSYVNYLPMKPRAVKRILDCFDQLKFDRIYGGFARSGGTGRIKTNAK